MDDKTMSLFDKPFSIEEHGYVKGVGFYILKSALHRRVREIDPRFRTTPPELMHLDDDMVMMRGGLTILGDTRFAVGTGRIDRMKWDMDKKQEVSLSPAEIIRNKIKAMKQAASDLLPRGAGGFGIGDYMRDVPREARTPAEFPEWLAHLYTAWVAKYPPAHWAHNGGGETVKTLILLWGLHWQTIASSIEPGIILTRLSDTSLTLVQFIARLEAIKVQTAQITQGTQQTEAAHDKIFSPDLAPTS
jgi:hypothetical protein